MCGISLKKYQIYTSHATENRTTFYISHNQSSYSEIWRDNHWFFFENARV